jgi:hypothetical protein
VAILRLTVGYPSLLGTVDNIPNETLFLTGSNKMPEWTHFDY